MLLHVGTNELLLDDSVRPAEGAREVDGVIVDLTPGVPHAFQTLVAAIDEADQELNRKVLLLTQYPHDFAYRSDSTAV